MKKFTTLLLALAAVQLLFAAPVLTYNGEELPWNTEFKRAQCGTLVTSANIKEVSGIACSRVTPGYIWMESDEYQNILIAGDEKGTQKVMTVNFPSEIRGDWEDLSGGVYNDKNYLFIGAFGDNGESWGDYRIIYLEEPAITPGEINLTPGVIKYQYPDGKMHNTEALMYDNVEKMIYIITKKYYDVCKVYKIPFRLDYGSTVQTLEYVCDLGLQSDIAEGTYYDKNKGENVTVRCKGFHLVTAADISPDGKYVLIKNHNNIQDHAAYSWILYWERQDGESISETVKRQPQPLKCYEYEWQGEAIAWLDDETFYTTSDCDGDNPPIYKYTRTMPVPKVERHFTIDGNLSDWSDLTGIYRAEVGSGATYDKLYEMRCYASETDLYFYLEFSGAEGDVTHIDFALNHDESTSGFDIWHWTTPTANLIEGQAADMSWASLQGIDPNPEDPNWPWMDLSISGFISACAPVALSNGHKAIEGKIVLNKLPFETTNAIKVGVFSSNSGWAESGMLPDGDMLEVPLYKKATGLESVTHSPSTLTRKVLIDGRLVIIRSDKMYTSDGKIIKN